MVELLSIKENKGFFTAWRFRSYPKVAISEHFTVSKAQTMIEVQSLIEPLNRHFWVGAVMRSFFFFLRLNE
jgi:hypothetical protein